MIDSTREAPVSDLNLKEEQLEGMDLWDRDVMFDARHRAVGAMLVRAAVAELRRHRAMVKRLEAWAADLDRKRHQPGDVGHIVADTLRARMRGDK
jgi:hypothetical protein